MTCHPSYILTRAEAAREASQQEVKEGRKEGKKESGGKENGSVVRCQVYYGIMKII